MSKTKLFTAEEAFDELFALPDHASDSEGEGDLEDEEQISCVPPVVTEPPKDAITLAPCCSTDNTGITTRKRKKEITKKSNVAPKKRKSLISGKETRKRANISASVVENNLSIMSTTISSSENEEVLSSSESENNGWSSVVSAHFGGLPSFDNPAAPEVEYSFQDSALPGHFFERFFDCELFTILCNETNRYAVQKQIKNWTPTSPEELQAFVGILILMGIHRLPSIDCYWSSDPLLRVDAVHEVMPCKRFKKVIEAFHCNDNLSAVKHGEVGYDKLHKVRPLLDLLNFKFQKEYKHSSCQSIDESMILFKGRSSMKQYMPMKPIKRGYKAWIRADPTTGYASQFEIYTGKKTANDVQCSDTLGSRVIKTLCNSIKVEEYDTPLLVVYDNFFSSFEIMDYLFEKKIYSVGTVRSNKKNLPKDMKQKCDLKRGECKYFTKQAVCAIQWKDNRPVNLLTTAHDPADNTEVKRTQKDGSRVSISCPKAIRDYTAYMRGVDRFDQLREYYTVSRRSKKYWFRLFYFLVDASLVNSYILQSIFHGGDLKSCNHLDFNIRVAQFLIGNFSSRKKSGAKSMYFMKKNNVESGKSLGVPAEVRFSNLGCHFPQPISSYRRCRLCSTTKQDKRSKIICSTCMVPLCIVPCFTKFHHK